MVGDIFIRLLRMIIIPLIMASMVAGIVSIGNIRNLGRIGLRTFIYYMATMLLAVGVGLVLVNLLQPRVGIDLGVGQSFDRSVAAAPSVVSIVTNIVPENLFGAMTARISQLKITKMFLVFILLL